jgi:hypothetical protein
MSHQSAGPIFFVKWFNIVKREVLLRLFTEDNEHIVHPIPRTTREEEKE